MTINQKKEDKKLTLQIDGRLDTSSSPELEALIDSVVGEVEELVFDLEKLAYVSSAGLRVILKAQKLMNAKGKMKVIHVNETIMEVFDITGFVDILAIE